MVMMVIAIVILVVSLLGVNKINGMFNRSTAEELEAYQESVFLHIEDRIKSYENEIESICNNQGKKTIDTIKALIDELEVHKKECLELEERLDEKLIKFSEFKKFLK